MRLRHALKLAQDQRRDHCAILGHLMFPPANRQVTTKRLAVIKVSAYDRGFQIEALLHSGFVTLGCVSRSIDEAVAVSGSSQMTDRLKSKVTRKFFRKFPPMMPD